MYQGVTREEYEARCRAACEYRQLTVGQKARRRALEPKTQLEHGQGFSQDQESVFWCRRKRYSTLPGEPEAVLGEVEYPKEPAFPMAPTTRSDAARAARTYRYGEWQETVSKRFGHEVGSPWRPEWVSTWGGWEATGDDSKV